MPSKSQKYISVSLHEELVEAVKNKIKKAKLGYHSVAEFITEAVREKLKK